jgi:hypothetical protein
MNSTLDFLKNKLIQLKDQEDLTLQLSRGTCKLYLFVHKFSCKKVLSYRYTYDIIFVM